MREATRQPAGDKGTADRIGADEGHYWVRLVTKQAMDREGSCMGHCVGDGGYDEYAGSEQMDDDAIWSLRRPDGVSVLTVRVFCLVVDYAKGPKNSDPGRFEAMQVSHLVSGFKEAGYKLPVEEDIGIVLLEDGRTFRKDRLPPDVVSAREAAARERTPSQRPGSGGGAAVFRPAALSGYFIGPARISLLSSERRDRPVIDSLRASNGWENPCQKAFEITRTLTEGGPDPVTRVEFTVSARTADAEFRFELRSGRVMRLSTLRMMELLYRDRISTDAAFRQAFLEDYSAFVGWEPAATPEAAPAGSAGPNGDGTPPRSDPLPFFNGVREILERHAPAPEAAPAEPDDLVRQEVRNIRRGEIVRLGTPDGESSFNVTDVQVLGRRGRPMMTHRYTVDAHEGIVRFHRNQPVAVIRFRPGARPVSVSVRSMGAARLVGHYLEAVAETRETFLSLAARAVSYDPLAEGPGRG